ncbi:SatD family protein [Rhodobacter sp. SY28-1]|uniref:SatD family protein n=1 Tax=Rhodobacter sp. SY28-1 TaxID=2562317 RepID=UPI0010C12877|nr:SatD family protein [Rhodobacter sp. SY28-1]
MSDAAVLTGDLIGSRKSGQQATDRALAAIADTAGQFAAPFTRYRGDGWQALLVRPELALRFALIVTARLRAQNAPLTRFGIGIAEIATDRAPSLGAETGNAFVLSGETLDQMPRRAEFAIASTTRQLGAITSAAARLADQVARKWTPQQAEAMVMALALDEPSGLSIAQSLGISPAAASYRLQGANWWDIKAVVSAFEAELKAADD